MGKEGGGVGLSLQESASSRLAQPAALPSVSSKSISCGGRNTCDLSWERFVGNGVALYRGGLAGGG